MLPLRLLTHPPLTATLLALVLSGCKSPEPRTGKDEKPADAAAAPATDSVDVEFLLSMSYDEAAAITKATGEVPGVARIAADSLEVVKVGSDGSSRRLRAKGHVFVEMDGGDNAKALSQEAYITENEIILRGRPVIKRGEALLEGLADHTVFYIFDNQVRAIGTHRVKNQRSLASLALDKPSVLASMRTGVGVPALPDAGPWKAGPNPLFPPLDDTAVPEEMRRQAEAERVLQASKADAGPAAPPPPLPQPELPAPSPTEPLSAPSVPPPPPPPPKPDGV